MYTESSAEHIPKENPMTVNPCRFAPAALAAVLLLLPLGACTGGDEAEPVETTEEALESLPQAGSTPGEDEYSQESAAPVDDESAAPTMAPVDPATHPVDPALPPEDVPPLDESEPPTEDGAPPPG
jgi:hypothetical protein